MKIYLKIAFIICFTFLCGCSTENIDSINNVVGNYTANVSDIALGQPNISEPETFDVNPEVSKPEDVELPIIADFSTEFKNATESRSHNITLASQKIDETIVMPGEEFSFNDTVGPTIKSNGFKLGRIFIKGKDAKGYGGGVCQVSSTLFNAAENAEMQITERHDHSKPVEYVEKGRDAATSYGGKDFKFINTKPFPIKVDSFIVDEKVVVAIMEAS